MMDLTLQLKGVDVLIQTNATFRKRLPVNVLGSIHRQLKRTITKINRDIATQSSIGRKIWGKNRSGLSKQVTLIKARASGDGKAIETGVKLVGIPKLIEDGGRIKPHVIKGDPWLVFQGKTGIVSVHSVNHPGGAVHAHRFARQHVERDTSLVLHEVRAGITKLIGETFGKSA